MSSSRGRTYHRVQLLLAMGVAVLFVARSSQAVENQRFILKCPAPYDSVVVAVQALGGEVTHEYENVGAVAVRVPASGRAELLQLPGVEAVYKDRIVGAPEPAERADVPASEIRGSLQGDQLSELLEELPQGYVFNLDITGASALHGAGFLGSDVLVAVIDSGTANNPVVVPSLAGRVIGGESFVPAAEDPIRSATSTRNDAHGTWVGSTMAANVAFLFSTDGVLVQSLLMHSPESVFPLGPVSVVPMVGTAPDADIYAIKVFPSDGGGAPESRIIAAMDRAITIRRNYNNGMPFVPVSGDGSEDNPFVFDAAPIQIVNMSLGGPTLFAGRDLEDSLTEVMEEVGITLVAATGNDGHAAMTGGSPGSGMGSLTSGAASLTPNERVLRDLQFGVGIGSFYRPTDHPQIATFSSRGPTADGRIDPDNIASGFAVFAQGADGGISVVSGTSFSAPNTSGGAALLREAEPGASARSVREALVKTSNPHFVRGAANIDQGHGFVDFSAALAHLGKFDRRNRHKRRGHHDRDKDDRGHDDKGHDDDDRDDGDHRDGRDRDHDDREHVSKRVRKNIAQAGFRTHKRRFSTRINDLIPGQVAHFFFESRKTTDRITITLDNLERELPPGQQNLFFGDDIFLKVADASTSFESLLVQDFVTSTSTFDLDDPQTGIVRIAVMGDWTNAGKISANLTVEAHRKSQGRKTADGEVGHGEVDTVLVEVPGGASEVTFELSWKENWGHYPTDDLDMVLTNPDSVSNFVGATLASPERVVIDSPTGGIWQVEIQGFTVHGDDDNDDDDDDDDHDDDDDDDGTSEWELRVTADGSRLKALN